MEKEYTNEESDALILQEMWLAEENSTINNEEVTEEEETQEVTEDVETETEEVEVEDEQEEEVEPRKPNKFAKVLHQRNEARKERNEALTQVEQLQARLKELEAEWNYWSEEYVQTLVDKRTKMNWRKSSLRKFLKNKNTSILENGLSLRVWNYITQRERKG